jgi:hypothetical protein
MIRYIAFLLGFLIGAPATLAQQVSDPVSSTAPGFIKKVTPSISADIAMLTTANTIDFTASQILDGAFLGPPGSGAKNLDGTRAVVFAPVDTTINLVNGVSAYVVSDAVTPVSGPGFPAAVGLFAAGVARGNGAKVWGVNTLLSDTMTGVVSTGTGKSLNNEFDFNVSSPNTTVLGLQLAGGSIVQPAAAYGVVLQPLDSGYPTAGTIKWTSFLQSNPGATNIFAGISPKQVTGASVKSQDIIMGFFDGTNTYGNLVITASSFGGLELYTGVANASALTFTGGPSRIAMPDQSGIRINDRVVLAASGAAYSLGSDVNLTTQSYSNATATTTIFGASIKLSTLPASAGAGGLAVCIDTGGQLYKKASCP